MVDLEDQQIRSDIEETLEVLFASKAFKKPKHAKPLLEYLIKQVLDGNQASIKAYTVGVDVLGKSDDFDPNGDASVRVAMGRLRNALADFYASDEGANAQLFIEIPKGTYVPSVHRVELVKVEPSESRQRVRRPVLLLLASITALLLAAFAVVLQLTKGEAEDFASLPTIDLPAVQAVSDSQTALVARGIREQLLIDLSYIKSLRVRDVALLDGVSVPESERIIGDYVLSTSVGIDGESLNIRLASVDRSILWADSFDIPQSDSQFYQFGRDIVGAIANRVGGERGVVSQNTFRRLARRVDDASLVSDDEYLCLVTSFAFDSTKDEATRERARNCLERLVENDSTNSTIHAQLAIVRFLDWARSGSASANDRLIQNALADARRSVQLDPENSVGFEHLGSILSAIGDRQGAIDAYERGLELTPWKPSLNFLLGWQKVLSGDWDEGMAKANQGVAMSPFAPGYMRIPNALDLFRRDEFEQSLSAAMTILQLGDRRGYVLAVAALAALGEFDEANALIQDAEIEAAFNREDPMHEVRNSFSNPSVIAKYDRLFEEPSIVDALQLDQN